MTRFTKMWIFLNAMVVMAMQITDEPFVVNDALNQRTAANQGDAAELRCEINSNPHSVIKWYGPGGDVIKKGNNIAIIITRNFTWQLNKLIINKKTGKDNGRYICNADNGIGSIDFTVVLSGKSFPDPATDIIVSSTHNTLHVVWNSGFNGGYPQSFFIEYGELPDGDQQFTEDTQDNELTVTKLQPLTGYYIIVVSTNALGEARSERLWTRTIEEPISSPIIIYLLSSALPILVLIAGSLMVVYLRMRCIKPRERQGALIKVNTKCFNKNIFINQSINQ
ncbi:synaptogenesis protein syg-2-like, partial [Saccoglossus kowalevskii]